MPSENQLILASGSPRRRELLAMLGVRFAIDPAHGEERPPLGASPQDTVKALALAKAQETASRHPGAVVIGADTVVELDGQILGKPTDAADAERMLALLSGREHCVHTGVAIVTDGKTLTGCETTRVRFRPLSGEEIRRYVSGGEPLDKAGAYGYQGGAAIFVEGIVGDYYNVVGLPLCRLESMLKQQGVALV